jgi:hypothetical protein
MKGKRKLVSISEEDFRLLMGFRTDERAYIDIFRKVLKNALFLQWVETHEPDIYYQLVRKYKESINQQSQTSQQVQQQPSQSSEQTQS